MPPFIPRKRHTASPEPPPAKRKQTASGKKATKPAKPKTTLFDAIDAPKPTSTAEEAKAFFATIGDGESDDSDADSDSDDFEDVPLNNAKKDDDDGEDMDWEDAVAPQNNQDQDDDSAIQDVNISLNEDGSLLAIQAHQQQQQNLKKAPSKRERQARIRAHCIHVHMLLFHNAVRNSWLNDAELHKILLAGLSEGATREVDRWKISMGMKLPEPKKKQKGKAQGKRPVRDWGYDADRLEPGQPDLSSGDPLLRLLQYLTAYWRKRFTVTAPGLRKQGYMPQAQITADLKAWAKDNSDFERYGERIENIEAFRKSAQDLSGSRDVGAQLFTALIRALGIEARMVASLQPVGFGWTKFEEAELKKPAKSNASVVSISDDESDSVQDVAKIKTKPQPKTTSKSKPIKSLKVEKPARKSTRNAKTIVLDDESSVLSSAPSDDEEDNASVIELTPLSKSKNPSKKKRKYDGDLPFPHYWTEVLSPVSKTYIPVDSIVLSTVASNQDLLATFEPRGKAADKARQVICYVVAHNADAYAKDVTVRYLKKHQLPGRTKGFRMPVEKVPILNKRGKVIKYEDHDFFKRIMAPFERPQKKRTVADDVEESTDLKPFKPATEKAKAETESLQWYKQSAEFVLEQHLRREEAILPNSKSVRSFTHGKGDKAKTVPVFKRSDVVNCKTVESWHKEGRQVKVGEQPLKMVPVRAVTLIRKREMEEAERETGEKLKQGLYSIDQTEWIIPPPIKDGVIPKNAFNNIDVYVPSMVPKGAVHIPLRSTARICRKLNIDYAEACTGFEFGKQRAVPVITGVVVAVEHEDAVIDAWEIEEAERKRKEDVKRTTTNLALWRKFLMGMRIVERLRADYRERPENTEVNPFLHRDKNKKEQKQPRDEESMGGGFLLPEDEDEEEEDEEQEKKDTGDMELDLGGGGFMPEDDDEEDSKPVTSSHFKPMSLQSAHRQQDDEDEADEQEESEEKIKTKTQRRKPAAKKTATAKSNTKAKPKVTPKRPARKSQNRIVSESEEEEEEPVIESSLSELTDASEDEELPAPKIKSSPRVVISPRKASRRVKKEVKSPYFSHEEMEEDVDDDDEGSESEEVVKPRSTTRRTRSRA